MSNEISDNLESISNSMPDAARQAVDEGLKPVFDGSQDIVPVDTGTLKASGTQYPAVVEGNVATGVISYGNGDTMTDWHGVGYEILVHTPGTRFYGGVPYLEQPLVDAKGTILKDMAAVFWKALTS